MVRKAEKSEENKKKDAERQQKARELKNPPNPDRKKDPITPLKEMSQEERREYNRDSAQKSRLKKRESEKYSMTPLKEMSQEERRAYQREKTQQHRLRMRDDSENVSGTPIKEMSPDELREYKRENARKNKVKKMLSAESLEELDTQESAVSDDRGPSTSNRRPTPRKCRQEPKNYADFRFSQMTGSQGTVASEGGSEYLPSNEGTQSTQPSEEIPRKSCSRAIGSRKRRQIPDTPSSQEMLNWTDKEKEEYKKNEERCLSQAKRAALESIQTKAPTRRKRKADKDSDVVEKEDLPEQQLNLKLRIGCMDIVKVETEAIVIPHAGPLDRSNRSFLYNRYAHKAFSEECHKEDYLLFLETDCDNLEGKYVEVRVQHDRKEIHSLTFHVDVPIVEDKYTLVTEARLRAAYLKCLIEADFRKAESISFPILGHGVNILTSVAIGIQVCYAYTQTVPETNLKLIYLLTNSLDEYDVIGEFLGYVRELDLSTWTRKQFFYFEKSIFDKLKGTVYYSTIPGTDMVWRCTKFSHQSRKKKQEQEELLNVHKAMCEMTKIPRGAFHIYEEGRDRKRIMPKQYIATFGIRATDHSALIQPTFPMDNVCGSNSALRRLWIVSYYYMYYSDTFNDVFNSEEGKVELEGRKTMFHRFKNLHRVVLKLWRRLINCPYVKCKCTKPDGFHEKLLIFSTRLSYPDVIFDKWLLFDKHIFIDKEEVPGANVPVNYATNPADKDVAQKKVVVEEAKKYSNVMERNLFGWFENVDWYSRQQTRNFQAIMVELGIDGDHFKTGLEDHLDQFADVTNFNNQLHYRLTTENDVDFEALLEAEKEHEMAVELLQIESAAQEVKRCLKTVVNTRFSKHFQNEKRLEQSLRNRLFRKTNPVSPQLWNIEDGRVTTVDQYVDALLKEVNSDFDPLPVIETTMEETFWSDDYPDFVDLGKRDVPCNYCGALSFAAERRKSCCKNGHIWVPPLKMLPPEILQVFDKPYRGCLISANAAFSMSSIHYNREPQKKYGVQSMKLRGLVSFHPSALHPKETSNPRYANFIVLENGNDEIAAMRFETLRLQNDHRQLKQIFFDIQEYLDENNHFYGLFKNMAQMEKEYLDEKGIEAEGATNDELVFRIIDAKELDLKDLLAHQGVYAKPKQMGKNYISVAYTMTPGDTNPLPRGLTIWPKNTTKPQRSISIFSDLCDLLSYPLFFPDGVGGFGIQKYPRWPLKTPGPLYETRIKTHARELLRNGEDPMDYYRNLSTQIMRAIYDDSSEDEQMDEEEEVPEEEEVDPEEDYSMSIPDNNGLVEIDENYETDTEEDDPLNLPVDHILKHGELEDQQEDPLNDEIGQQTNITMVERGGFMYPELDVEHRMIDIPLVSGNPIGIDSDEEMEEPEFNRFDDGTDCYINLDLDAIDTQNEQENVVEMNQPSLDNQSEAVEEEHDILDSQSEEREQDRSENQRRLVEAVFEEEPDDICCGDEPTTRNRHAVTTIQNVGKRKWLSVTEYANFILQDRREIPCRFQGAARTLGQLISIDYCIRAIEQRLNVVTDKRTEFPRRTDRATLFDLLEKSVDKTWEGKKKLGALTTMPSTVPGTAKYQRELVMTAVTVANTLGKPQLFITFTGNPKWKEIQEEEKRLGCQWPDIPEFVNKVFKTKFDMMLEDVVGKKTRVGKKGRVARLPGIFGEVTWYTYSVEFQQRGMPHVHMLLALKKPITTAAEVDEIVSAQVPEMPLPSEPNYAEKKRYYEYVRDLMTHRPCDKDPTAYCNVGRKSFWNQCTKGFPKQFSDVTVLTDNKYPTYARKDGKKFEIYHHKKRCLAGSEFVVSHNKFLLLKYNCHINVEVVSTVQMMKYIFKYIFKGNDRMILEAKENMGKDDLDPLAMTLKGNVFATNQVAPGKLRRRQEEADRLMDKADVKIPGNKRVAINDCTYFLDMSAMTACEAVWRNSGFPLHGCSHVVPRGYVTEENNDAFYIQRGVTAAQAKQLLKQKPKSMLQAWFDQNKSPRSLPGGRKTTDLTFDEMFAFFSFDIKGQKFKYRGGDHSHRFIGRIQAPQPRYLELTATRLLAQNVAGPTCWEDLRTYQGKVYPTCLEAARARRLMNGEIEWDDVISEVAREELPVECRRIFVSVLIHCAPANPRELWERHWHELVNTNHEAWTDAQRKAHALRHIRFLLQRHGMDLNKFELQNQFVENDLPFINPVDDVDNPNAVQYSPATHRQIGLRMYAQLNPAQKSLVDRALALDDAGEMTKMLYVDGPGGAGKTFCYITIYHLLLARGRKVCPVSHAGIAASLLPNGCTAHRKFSIPLEVKDLTMCTMKANTPEWDALRAVDCVIWDEIVMSDCRIIDAVNRLLQDVKNCTLPFGGVLVIMGGDWRQILPIVEGYRDEAVLAFTIKNWSFWNEVEKFALTQNQRAIDDPLYAQMILDIGNGDNYYNEDRKLVSIPENFILKGPEHGMIDWVFPEIGIVLNGSEKTTGATKNAAILTIDNKTALRINDIVLNRVPGEVREFVSIDAADKNNALNVDPEFFATQTPSGMPPHRLRLKVGAQVTLLRNISVEQGLCNGTRLTIDSFGDDIIYCYANSDTSVPKKRIFLHRMVMAPTGNGARSSGFTRRQFPIRLAYVYTINKSQGQTLGKCGLLLHSPVFSHGQLYVAMSRVKKGEDFKIWHYKRNNADDFDGTGGILVRNVVYKDALR